MIPARPEWLLAFCVLPSKGFCSHGNPNGHHAHHITPWAFSGCRQKKEKAQMLWTIFVILLVLWLVGLVSFHAIGWYIHILLVVALIVLLIQLISGRRPVV